MAINHKIFNPTNRVALSMPPSVSVPWIVDLLQRIGGTFIEGEEIMLQEELCTNLQSKQQAICQDNTKDVHHINIDHIQGSVSGRENHTFQTPELKHRISFYRSGDHFWIGEQGKEKGFNITQGLKFIHFLLQHKGKQFRPFVVYHLGKTHKTNEVTMIDDELVIKGVQYIRSLDRKARSEYKNRIEQLNAELESPYVNPEERLQIKEEIKMLETMLKEKTIRDPKSSEEKSRVNVQKNISNNRWGALQKIHKMCPELKRYLNESTIKTGDWCSYAPIPNDPVEWVLFRK